MTATAAPNMAGIPAAKGSWRPWVALAAATFSGFISLLNVTSTNTSLPQIQASIGASGTEGTWVGTAYLAAEVVMIPLTAWLSRLLGMRLFLTVSVAFFTIFGVMCALAHDLNMMIVSRALQGFAGGALLPAGITIIATRLSPEQRPLGLAIYGTITAAGPLVGPQFGGWLTESLSWHWIFLSNIPMGLLMITLCMIGLDPQPIHKEELAKADWVGICGLSAFLASLIIVLEDGQRENWFDSEFITTLTISGVIGFMLVIYAQWTHPNPVLKLRLFRSASFSATVICTAVQGGANFSTIYLVPTFLGLIAGYDPRQTGVIASYSGLAACMLMPFLTSMLRHFDIRLLIAIGFFFFAMATLLDTRATVETVGGAFILSQLIRGAAQMTSGLPLSQASTVGLAPVDIPDGAAMYTVSRNLGGAVFIAIIGIVIDRQTAFHAAQIGARQTANSFAGQERINQITGMIADRHANINEAHQQAFKLIGQELHRQALVLAYIDAFWVVSLALLVTMPVILLIRQPVSFSPATAH